MPAENKNILLCVSLSSPSPFLVVGTFRTDWGIQDQRKIFISSVQHFEPDPAFKVLESSVRFPLE
jgi:hypothetical protein